MRRRLLPARCADTAAHAQTPIIQMTGRKFKFGAGILTVLAVGFGGPIGAVLYQQKKVRAARVCCAGCVGGSLCACLLPLSGTGVACTRGPALLVSESLHLPPAGARIKRRLRWRATAASGVSPRRSTRCTAGLARWLAGVQLYCTWHLLRCRLQRRGRRHAPRLVACPCLNGARAVPRRMRSRCLPAARTTCVSSLRARPARRPARGVRADASLSCRPVKRRL